MPTLAPPEQFFGYSRKRYDDYFPQARRPSYGVPMNADPYGMEGEEERQLAAQQKVLEVLGTMDEIEEAKRQRAMRLEYQPQIEALQREELTKKFSGIGAQDRQRQTFERLSRVDPATPEGKMEFSRAFAEARTPDEQKVVMDAAGAQERILGPEFGGEELKRDQRAVADYMASLPPSLRGVAQKSGGKTLAEIQGAVEFRKAEEQKKAELAELGVDPKEFPTLMDDTGYLDPVKVNLRKHKAKLDAYERPMTTKDKENVQRRGLLAIDAIERRAYDDAIDLSRTDDPEVMRINERIGQLKRLHMLDDDEPAAPPSKATGKPTAAPAAKGGGVKVTYKGKVLVFPDAKSAEGFKTEAGIK